MTKVKLANGGFINASAVELIHGSLRITTTEHTVEELAAIFSDKSNTSLLTFLTESDVESGYKVGFTSFAGINYDSEGNKTVELFQPADVTEARISNAEGAAKAASLMANEASTVANIANNAANDANNAANLASESVSEAKTVANEASFNASEAFEKVVALEEQNAVLTECVLEMSEMLYA